MWSIEALDVIHLGRSPGGDRFTQFVDAIIHAHAFTYSIPYANIFTNLRTNKPDGGVDTKVTSPVMNDPTGWMSVPTIWQYKATEAGNVASAVLKDEITKDYAKQCIAEGYGYRFCICDSLPAEKKEKWENELTQHARAIDSDAPAAKVLTADDLATWAGHFPPLVLRFFRRGVAGIALHLHAWKQNAIALTPTFVPVQAWEPIQESIRKHVDQSVSPAEVILSIQGQAGVGKTRMVYEELAGIPGAENVAFYTSDEGHALQIAQRLANGPSLKGILVADECSLQARVRLLNLLQGHKKRIRVIAIDNTGERPPTKAPEFWIEKIPSETLEKILEENYSDVPAQRRRLYADQAGGFVILAADMCAHDKEIQAIGRVGPAVPTIRDYYRYRLTDDEQAVVEALALVTRIGYKGEVAEELNHLCSLIGRDREEVLPIANKLHDVPGFVARAGRFLYVTPEIIAQIAFDRAWQRWGKDDPEQFVKRIPDPLLEIFQKRVARSATEEVRCLVSAFFRRWASTLGPKDLTDITKVDRLVTLVDTEPDAYLPVLRRLVERASREELLAVTGEGVGRWGPRRSLVWLAERMAVFPEYFDDAERVLFELALAESEPRIGNNATNIWRQFFRILLSGTAVPFLERFEVLQKRIYSENPQVSDLALEAYDGLLSSHAMRRAGPLLVAGRIPPEEWRPKTRYEHKTCVDAVVSLLCELSKSDSQQLRSKAYEITIKYMRSLLRAGYLGKVKSIFVDDSVSDEIRTQVVAAVEEFLHYDAQPSLEKSPLPAEYAKEVSEWLATLRPADLHGRLVTLVGVDPWHYRLLDEEESWQNEIQSLATELYRNRDSLKQELGWLCSDNARSAGFVGKEIGRQDLRGSVLELIVESSLQYEATALARGYIQGLVDVSPSQHARLNKLLDQVEQDTPKIAYELFMAGGYETKALERTLRLVDTGKLPPIYLQGFVFGVRSTPLPEEDFKEALKRLASAVEGGDNSVRRMAIDFVSHRLSEPEKVKGDRILDNQEIQELVWQLVEATTRDAGGVPYKWTKVLKTLVPVAPERVARIAAVALVSEELYHKRYITALLTNMASNYPGVVMKQLGKIILDEQWGWYFYIDKHDGIIQSLPSDVVIGWVKNSGLEAARRLARHLPTPYIGSDGEPAVPPLTEFVLKTFEGDDRLFREFCAGVHSLQIYSGDIPAQHEREAEVARKFLNHPIRRIREWAEIEVRSSLRQARQWRQMDEEFDIE